MRRNIDLDENDPGVPGPDTSRHHQLTKGLWPVWDLSENPTDNSDRDKKLGKQPAQKLAAIYQFDDASHASTLFDGVTAGEGLDVLSQWTLEPDNMALRLHTSFGKDGVDNVWAIRLTVDDVHKDYERRNRSTMVISQCPEQDWAWTRDQWKVRRLGASNDHAELAFDKAGFLKILRQKEASVGKNERAALWLNVSKRGGYYTDGKIGAQLWHVLHISPLTAGTQSAADSGCGSVMRYQGTLRGDVLWDLKGTLASLAFSPPPPITGGKRLTGMHFIDIESPLPPKQELDEESEVSNQVILPRKTNKGIWVYVQQPEEWYPVRPPVETPVTFTDRPAGYTAAPSSGSQGNYVGDTFAAGTVEGYTTTLDVAENVPRGWGVNIAVDFLTPAGGWGGNSAELQLDAIVTKLGVAQGAALDYSQSKTVSAASYSVSDAAARAMFFIPHAKIKTKPGGKISASLYRRGDRDTLAGGLLVLGMYQSFGPEITRIA